MQEPAIPANEAERLQALRTLDILDSPPEARFDRITQIAQHLFDVPIALISLVDMDRQWFKSCQGLDATETPRNISFCGHAILGDDVFYIPDATRDPRFADNPLVTGPPNIRAYVGAPLRMADNIRIGTLCIIDDRPREFTAKQFADLRNLADWVQDELGMLKLSEAMALIRSQEARLQAILSNVPDVIVTLDANANILSANAQLPLMFGLDADQVVGQRLTQLLPEVSQARFAELIGAREREKEKPISLTVGLRANGERFPVDLMLNRMETAKGAGYVMSIRDVSDAHKLDHMKREFVSIVSHELRTPLTAIRGALGLVVGGVAGPVSEKVGEMLGIADDNCERLITLVNDILDLEKIGLGRLSFDLAELSLAPVIERAVELNQDYAQGFKVRLEARCEADSAVRIRADEDRLLQVLTNLIANAVKFSPEGEVVTLVVRATEAGDKVRFEIRDHGPGIPADMRERVFEKFHQVDSPSTRRKGGTGLGLSIARAIVEAFDGRIGVECPDTGGSLFWFEIPVLNAPP